MILPEVINASSWKSAQVIQKKDIGHLSVGTVADIAVFKLEKGNFGFVDSSGYKMQGDKKLVCEEIVFYQRPMIKNYFMRIVFRISETKWFVRK